MKTECHISKEGIEKAHREYDKKDWEKNRFHRLGINIKEKNGLWKLWVLALFYQAANEKASETSFRKSGGLLFSPKQIMKLAEKCKCPLLSSANKVYFCDFKRSKGTCSNPQFFESCPIPKIAKESGRFARISKQITASALYLRDYGYEFENFYSSIQRKSIEEKTQSILDAFTVMSQSEKAAHLFLGWVSNPVVCRVWDLNYEQFLPIDMNIKRVVRKVGLCSSPNTGIIRVHLHEMQKEMKLNPKVLELALLHIGQEYCKKEETDCKNCPFGKDAAE